MSDRNIDEFSQLWPYASDQYAQIAPLLNRLTTWKAVLNTLINCFCNVQDIERHLGKEHGKLHRSLEELQCSLGSDSASVLNPWRNYAQFFECEYLSTENLVATSALNHLRQLKIDLKRKIHSVESNIKLFKSKVQRNRNLTMSGIATHERTLSKHSNDLKADPALPFGAVFTSDPWLSERSLYHQLKVMVIGENEFQENIRELVRDLATFDCHIVETLMITMDEYASARSSQWESMQKHMASIRSFSALSEPESHFSTFAATHHLHNQEIWQRTRTLYDFPYQVREIQILKHGLLHIPSKFSKNSWLPVVAVITETGFLHCFKISAHKKTRLMEWTARQQLREEEFENGIESPISSSHHSEVPSLTQLSSSPWPSLTSLRRNKDGFSTQPLSPGEIYNGVDRPAAAISVGLGQSRITIQLVPEKSNQHIFELIIQNRRPRSGGIFSGWSKPNVDSWTRFEFKASSDNELIEWLAALQGRMQNFVPRGPPSPLFKSQQFIEQSVEAMIKEHHERALSDVLSAESLDMASQPSLSRIRQTPLPIAPARTYHRFSQSDSTSSSTLPGDSGVLLHDGSHLALHTTPSYKVVSTPKLGVSNTPRTLLKSDLESEVQAYEGVSQRRACVQV
ncbi:hypothetical protein BSLG_004256 [Batrachochytrium salamandrivorans]|nr:hypothetical protein BASA60_001975 [Batrachochytrium salamandrivorans]KAJ1341132.1 hypothetical protein BSLG_004256 [Batrachochytrium salamandrivorans]